MNKRRMNFLLYYVVFAATITMLYGSSNWLTYYRLTSKGSGTKAVVTRTDCTSTKTFSYRFTVGGQSFEGSGGGSYGNPSCNSLKPGDQVLVYYLASDPKISAPGDAEARLINESIAIALAALFFPLVLLFILFAVFKLMRKQDRS